MADEATSRSGERSTGPVRPLLVGLVAVVALAGLAEVGLRIFMSRRGLGAGDFAELLRPATETSADEKRGRLSLRDLLRASPHDDLVYELKPHLRGTFRGKLLLTNSQGFRGPERSVEKPESSFRIVGLGDSEMLGWGVAEGQYYLDILERRLNAAEEERRFEVLNFACPTYNTAQEIALLERRALRFDPDLIVLHFVSNDFAPPWFDRSAATDATSRWYLVGLARAALGAGGTTELTRRTEGGEASEGAPDSLRGAGGFRDSMARLGRLSRERSIPVVVMMLGQGDARREAARDAAKAEGFRFVDALPFFHRYMVDNDLELTRRVWRQSFYTPQDGHSTPLGHELFADVLFAELAAMGIV